MVFVERTGQRGGAGAFGEVVRVVVERAHGGFDLVVGDFDEAGYVVPDGFHGARVGLAAGEPIGDAVWDGASRTRWAAKLRA